MYSKTMRTTGPGFQAVIERNVKFLYSQELMELDGTDTINACLKAIYHVQKRI
jgi:hypothetical protein